jgi:hypothetical protein
LLILMQYNHQMMLEEDEDKLKMNLSLLKHVHKNEEL